MMRRSRRTGRCSSKRRKVEKRKVHVHIIIATESSANEIIPCQGFKMILQIFRQLLQLHII
jgi:hypothetical protein